MSSGGTCAVLLQDTGFFLVSDHGIEDNVIDEAFQKAKSALDLPDTVKKNYPFSLDRYVGWRGLDELQSVTGELSLTRSNVPPAMIIRLHDEQAKLQRNSVVAASWAWTRGHLCSKAN